MTDFHRKSTLAKQLAHNLGYVYVDTGAMYRIICDARGYIEPNILTKNH
jgi:cytidylate kinase